MTKGSVASHELNWSATAMVQLLPIYSHIIIMTRRQVSLQCKRSLATAKNFPKLQRVFHVA